MIGPAGFIQAPKEKTFAGVKRVVVKGGKVYKLSYDEYNTLDTVECAGKMIVSTNATCKQIINNADKFLDYEAVKGFTYF